MVFNSLHFAFFFALVFGGAVLLRRRVGARNAFLLAASYYFYGSWDWRFLGLILLSTVVDYGCGLALDREPSGHGESAPPRRTPRERRFLLLSLVTNLGLLGTFKYFDFFAESAREALLRAGIEVSPPTLGVILPVGISFYTFQTLSYTIDLYRGRIAAERSLLNFALFVAFFPQLVAGPIERASRLLPQLSVPSRITWKRIYTGTYLIGAGLFKKVVIADNVSRVADHVFAQDAPGGAAVLIGVYAFAIQIYCDFSGYSDVARGAARCMGFDLMLNFDLPYFATNPSDFWRRWHISLSTWLRDYLYIPLGGNRRGPARTYVYLMTTMVLGGLWHGAAWTFVAWGVFHGALLCVHRVAAPALARLPIPKRGPAAGAWTVVRTAVFFQLVCVGWLFFRAESMTQAVSMLGAAVRDSTSFTLDFAEALDPSLLSVFAVAAVFLFLVQLAQFRARDHYLLLRAPVPVRALAYALLVLAFLWLGEFGGDAFIYFQF